MFMTQPEKFRRPVSSYHTNSRSLHNQSATKLHKQSPIGTQVIPPKQKSVGREDRHEIQNRQRSQLVESLKERSSTKQVWPRVVDTFHVFIEISEAAKASETVAPSATVTPSPINDYQTSIYSRTAEKLKTLHLRKNSFCQNSDLQVDGLKKKKSYFIFQEERERRRLEDSKREKRSFDQETTWDKFTKSRFSQKIEQPKELILGESKDQQYTCKFKEIILSSENKAFSKYELNKQREQQQRKLIAQKRLQQNLQKVLQQQKPLKTLNLFDCLLKANLSKGYHINIPETIMVDEDRLFQLLCTKNGVVTKLEVKKTDAYRVMQRGHEMTLNMLKGGNNQAVYSKMYDSLIDPKLNEKAPFVAIGYQKSQPDKKRKKIHIQIQNVKYFSQNAWNSNDSSFLQRYVYSRNLKALIMRAVYQKPQRGQQRQEYYIDRFQNFAYIFGENSGFHDLRAKVSPSYGREYTLEHSKLTGKGLVNRYIQPTKEIKRLIEGVEMKRISKLWVDFIEDIAGTLWVIGVKAVIYQQNQSIRTSQLWLISQQVGTCRLCNGVFQKRHLQNSVSVRMLLQFLNHLRRRTRIEDLPNFQFVNFSSLNKKEHAMSAVCECCYELIIRELQLKKYQRELGRICNITVDDDGEPQKIERRELRQWRLMVYLDEITEQSKDSSNLKVQNLAIRYALAKGLEEKWRCKVEKQVISIKRVKVHYFFSESSNIEDFLKNTQILVSVLSGDKQENEKVIAQGSTGILANFRNKCATQNGQRQTSTVLLFFQSRKYCALTLKVGLVYDGVYKIPEIPMIKVHSVMFPAKNWLNSNPLPKEWMEAFGYGEEINLAEFRYEDILKKKDGKKSTLAKKKIKNFF